ncbi:hypothetical protein HYH03_008623 [Edaphochlamys debaryana]|uniref:ShKT domain-containing protein n=1 Tax=Edaphochlamys debaryana TaxID=47281 RepID=A0A835XZM4_9CHLO|nr:hypothetical protein HYH03_008623 [Edaphochlamys debaryana]|eukprot:KAG2493203.1 hypothetical protein HYH03_008623 [Edaphochlamys debaryana]
MGYGAPGSKFMTVSLRSSIPSSEECCNVCGRTPECAYWTYSGIIWECYLFRDQGLGSSGFTPLNGHCSGPRPAGVSSPCVLTSDFYGNSTTGTYFDETCLAAGGARPITRLDWNSGHWFDVLQFTYGGTAGGRLGNVDLALTSGIALNSGERITSVRVYTTNFSLLAVARLEVGTSTRTFVVGSGQPLIDPKTFVKWPVLSPDKPTGCPSTSEKRLIAVRGTFDNYLRSISFVWAWPGTCTIRGDTTYGAPGSQFMTLLGALSAAACCTACGNNAACAYWSWSSTSRDCRLVGDQGAGAYAALLGYAAGPRPAPACADKDASCATWKTPGYCAPGYTYNNQSVPNVLCQKTCGICGLPAPSPPRPPSPRNPPPRPPPPRPPLPPQPPRPLPPGPCADTSEFCAGWAMIGNCENQYAAYMQANCQKSCGLCGAPKVKCQDANTGCAGWASLGYCTDATNAAYMTLMCRGSCGLCSSG